MKVQMVLSGAEFRAVKLFERSSRPHEGDREQIRLRDDGGYTIAKIRWVTHFTEEDIYEAVCDDALGAMCRLYLAGRIDGDFGNDNGNWKMEKFSEFELDPRVVKEIATINDLRKKFAQET